MPNADVNGLSICYERSGPEDGPVLLLVGGMGQQLISWPPHLLDPLHRAGIGTVTFDNRDVGRSTWMDEAGPADIGGIIATLRAGGTPDYAYTIRDLADDAVGLLDHLGLQRVHVLGPSMGGMIVQRMAIDHPDRVASLTSVMSTTGRRGLPGATKEANAALLEVAAPGLEGYLAGRAHRRAAYGSTGFAFDEAWELELAKGLIERGLNPDGGSRQYAATIADGDRTEALGRLDLPALVVHGDVDNLIPPAGGEATAAAIPGARLHIVEGMGHDLPPAVCRMLADDVIDLIGVS